MTGRVTSSDIISKEWPVITHSYVMLLSSVMLLLLSAQIKEI